MNSPIRVLYVEGSDTDKRLVREAFARENRDFEIVEADNWETAERLLQGDRFDLILSGTSSPLTTQVTDSAPILQRQKEQLHVAEKELDLFAYSISHDLRAPLRAIEGFAKILLEDFAADLQGDARKYLGIVTQSAEKLQAMIDGLLSFSRLTRTSIQPSELNMKEMAESVASVLRQSPPNRSFQLEVGVLPAVQADPAMIRTVWQQLLSNAVKFARPDEEARVVVAGVESNGECIYSVRDNGIGFDSEYSSKLFNVFQKLHTEEIEGTGIGLAIAQRIIHRHRGRIWAESKPNQGSAFHFSLPRTAPQDR